MKECTSCKKSCENIFNDQTTRIGVHCVLKIDNKIFNEIFLCPQCSLQALSGILLSPQNDLENPTVTITGYHACFDITKHVESLERKAFEAAREMGKPMSIIVKALGAIDQGMGRDLLRTKYVDFNDYKKQGGEG